MEKYNKFPFAGNLFCRGHHDAMVIINRGTILNKSGVIYASSI